MEEKRKISWIVKRFRKYGRKISWILKWFRKYGRKVGWIEERFGKYGRKVSWIVKIYRKNWIYKLQRYNCNIVECGIKHHKSNLYLQRHIPTYLSIYIFIRIIDFIQFFRYIFTIQLTFLPYFPNLSTIQPTFLPYFLNHFNIQLIFLLCLILKKYEKYGRK
jgi:hypothetical protein